MRTSDGLARRVRHRERRQRADAGCGSATGWWATWRPRARTVGSWSSTRSPAAPTQRRGGGRSSDPARPWIPPGTPWCRPTCWGAATGPPARRNGPSEHDEPFPELSPADLALAHVPLLEHLGVERLALATGGSLGGMVTLEWGRRSTVPVDRLVVFAAPAATSAQAIAWNTVQRMAIEADPAWRRRTLPAGPGAGRGAGRGSSAGDDHLSLGHRVQRPVRPRRPPASPGGSTWTTISGVRATSWWPDSTRRATSRSCARWTCTTWVTWRRRAGRRPGTGEDGDRCRRGYGPAVLPRARSGPGRRRTARPGWTRGIAKSGQRRVTTPFSSSGTRWRRFCGSPRCSRRRHRWRRACRPRCRRRSARWFVAVPGAPSDRPAAPSGGRPAARARALGRVAMTTEPASVPLEPVASRAPAGGPATPFAHPAAPSASAWCRPARPWSSRSARGSPNGLVELTWAAAGAAASEARRSKRPRAMSCSSSRSSRGSRRSSGRMG